MIIALLVVLSALCVLTVQGLNLFNSNKASPPRKQLEAEVKVLEQNKVEVKVLEQNVIGKTTIPSNGLIGYIGDTSKTSGRQGSSRWETDEIKFVDSSKTDKFMTRFNLWKQFPWKKFKGKRILKAKLGGSLGLTPANKGVSFGGIPDFESLSSLQELTTLFMYGAYDPRVKAVYLDVGRIDAGYAKLTELKRYIEFFRQSGKKVYAYSTTLSEKEVFITSACDATFIPPDGSVDLRGFVASATFVRGVFDKLGIEPQVQRIGKYKSFGDTFNRTEIAEAQREVISSLLMEASEFWLDKVSEATDNEKEQVAMLWTDKGVRTANEILDKNIVTGILYGDEVEALIKREMMDEGAIEASFLYSLQIEKRLKDLNETGTSAEDYIKQANATRFAVLPSTQPKWDLQQDFDKSPRRKLDENFPKSSASVEEAAALLLGNATLQAEAKSKAKDEAKTREKEQAEEIKEEKLAKKRLALDESVERKISRGEPSYLPAGLYLRKMRKGARILRGLRFKEVRDGPRVAIINAAGGINTGKSGSGGIPGQGKTLGSDTVIDLVRRAKADPGVKAVVIRVDSPGGSALASDLMWREVRALSAEKPVVASMVDVAASGGYYISMACDTIFAEELTVTGSIGVVTSKFNAQGLFKTLGLGSEIVSRGRYAEVLASSQGFSEDEEEFFSDGAQQAYLSFITKAAASRNMSVEDMNEVAQGRVWTGRQALERGLVDNMGGQWAAVRAAAYLADLPTDKVGYRVQTLTEPQAGFKVPGTGASLRMDATGMGAGGMDASLLLDTSLADTPLLSTEAAAPVLAAAIGTPLLRGLANTLGLGLPVPQVEIGSGVGVGAGAEWLEDLVDRMLD